MGGRNWTEGEVAILKKHGSQKEIEEIQVLLDRTFSAIARKARRLDIKLFRYCEDCGAPIGIRAHRCNSCAQKMVWATEELRNQLVRSFREHWANEENRARRSRERNANKEWGYRQAEAVKAAWERGAYNSEETKHKHAEAIQAAWDRGDFNGEERSRKISEGNKAAHARGAYDDMYNDEEYRRKRSEVSKAAWARGAHDGLSEIMEARWARGDFDGNSEALKAAHARGDFDGNSKAMRAAWARGDFDGVFQSPTSIELQVAAALDICSIEHHPQYRPEGYSRIYDEFIPPNTLIEVQGDYWHGDKRPENQKRDAEKAQWAKEHGYRLIEIWQHEIQEYGAWAMIMQKGLLSAGRRR